MVDLYRFYGINPVHGVGIYGVLKSCFIKQYGYKALYFEDRSRILSMAGTRSSVVEEFEAIVNAIDPSLKWELQSVDGLEEGWYLLRYLTVPKNKQYQYAGVKYESTSLLVRKRFTGGWDMERIYE